MNSHPLPPIPPRAVPRGCLWSSPGGCHWPNPLPKLVLQTTQAELGHRQLQILGYKEQPSSPVRSRCWSHGQPFSYFNWPSPPFSNEHICVLYKALDPLEVLPYQGAAACSLLEERGRFRLYLEHSLSEFSTTRLDADARLYWRAIDLNQWQNSDAGVVDLNLLTSMVTLCIGCLHWHAG